MGTILSLILAIICAYICCKMAKACGANTLIACILGAIFNILAVAGYGILIYRCNNK